MCRYHPSQERFVLLTQKGRSGLEDTKLGYGRWRGFRYDPYVDARHGAARAGHPARLPERISAVIAARGKERRPQSSVIRRGQGCNPPA